VTAAAKPGGGPRTWWPTTRTGRVALAVDVMMLGFPLWLFPSWYLVSYLAGAGTLYESPRAVFANSVFQAAVVAVAVLTNLAALVLARDRSVVLVMAVIPLSGVLAYMGWVAAVRGFPGIIPG